MEEKTSVSKVVIIVAIVAVVAAGLAFLLINASKDDAPTTTQQTESTNQQEPLTGNEDEQNNATASVLTSDEVKKHNSASDCWTIINGNVYNLTSFISRHPGGDEILRACGKNGTKLFTTRTDENGNAVGSGTPHSSSAESQLESLKLGPVQN